MSRVCARTTAQRTRIRWCDDANERCSGSSQLDQPSDSSLLTPQSTTRSISSATSFPVARCAFSGAKQRSNGSARPLPHEQHRISIKLRFRYGSRDSADEAVYAGARIEPDGSGRIEHLAQFRTNPAGAQIVNAVGALRQIVDPTTASSDERRYFTIMTMEGGQPGRAAQVQQPGVTGSPR
jgi:hypothetical protein